MHSSLPKRTLLAAYGALVGLAAVVGLLLYSVPPVEGLGNKVKLPLFHGGSTWVDLMVFTLMGIAALVYLVRRDERVYAWEVGFRAVAAPLWAVNSVLGYVAARSTWDFTGSQEPPWMIAVRDPRLLAQLLLLFAVAVLVLLDWLVLEHRVFKAGADALFVVVMWALLANVFLDPVKRALHPDSPVLNSGWEIKAPFFGMVVAIFAATIVVSWLVSSCVRPGLVAEQTPESPAEPPADA